MFVYPSFVSYFKSFKTSALLKVQTFEIKEKA